ncbi:thiolase family protein [Novosphingobium sp.]|uniref:thiolase family protein n=1 Tax=Novosphingobium sp. TaxID=1874826 RepID=UPI00333EAE11
MTDAYIVGSYSSSFGKFPDRSHKDLTREVYLGVLADAGLARGDDIGMAWFGNCGMWTDGQGSIRGQVCLTPLVREGLFPERVPVINVEGGCATASIALHGAWKDVLSGQTDLSIAFGVEKTFNPGAPDRTTALFDGGIDQYDRDEWLSYYAAAGDAAGKPFAPGPGRTIFMDTYAMQAAWHMRTHGTTDRQIAIACAKNHTASVHNPKAQYRFALTADDVLADRPVSWPLTRAMCAPIGDGAAAALVCSGAWLARQPAAVRARAVRIAASTMTAGKYRRLDEPGLSQLAAQRAYRAAGLTAADIDLAEVHDATSFCELYQSEMLGFCGIGEGGRLAESGATAQGGSIPINLSGGLVSKGHPVGATGLSMIDELMLQLRGEAGPRQVSGARTALAENGGGVMGFDEAACSVIILQRD